MSDARALKPMLETELGAELQILIDCLTGADGGVAFAKLKTYFEYLETFPEKGSNAMLKEHLLRSLKQITGTVKILSETRG